MRPTGGVVIVRRSHAHRSPGDPRRGLPSRVPRQGSGAGCLHPGRRRWHGLVVVCRCQAASCATVGQAVLPGPARLEIRRTDCPSNLGSAGRSSDRGYARWLTALSITTAFRTLSRTGSVSYSPPVSARALSSPGGTAWQGGAVHPCLGLLARGVRGPPPHVVTYPVGERSGWWPW